MLTNVEATVPAPDVALVALAAVKTELSIADAAQDAWLTAAIRQASAALAAYCRRPEGFGRATWTQTWRAVYAGQCAAVLILARDLAPGIVSVTEDGRALATTDFLLDGSLLRRLSNDAPAEWRASKIVAVYRAGWTLPDDLPDDVERCCLDLVVRAHQAKGRDPGLRSERILDVIAQSWDTPGGDGFKDGLPRDVAERLAPYIRWTV